MKLIPKINLSDEEKIVIRRAMRPIVPHNKIHMEPISRVKLKNQHMQMEVQEELPICA